MKTSSARQMTSEGENTMLRLHSLYMIYSLSLNKFVKRHILIQLGSSVAHILVTRNLCKKFHANRRSFYREAISGRDWSPCFQNVSTKRSSTCPLQYALLRLPSLTYDHSVMLNSLLALLNSRGRMRNQMASTRPVSIGLSLDKGTSSGTASSDHTLSNRNAQVNFDVHKSYVPNSEVQVCSRCPSHRR